MVIDPQTAALANQAAYRAYLSTDDMVPLVGARTEAHPPLAYGMPDGNIFPWDPEARTLVGVVRLYTKQDIAQYRRAKAAQQMATPSGIADHLQDIVRQTQAEIEAAQAFKPTHEALADAGANQQRLARERQQMLNAFRVPS